MLLQLDFLGSQGKCIAKSLIQGYGAETVRLHSPICWDENGKHCGLWCLVVNKVVCFYFFEQLALPIGFPNSPRNIPHYRVSYCFKSSGTSHCIMGRSRSSDCEPGWHLGQLWVASWLLTPGWRVKPGARSDSSSGKWFRWPWGITCLLHWSYIWT